MPPATRTVPSSSSVARSTVRPEHGRRWRSRTRCPGRTRSAPGDRPAARSSTVPSDNSVVDASRACPAWHVRGGGPGPGGRVVQLDGLRCRPDRTAPTTSTLPSGCRKASMASRWACMFAIAVHDPVSGSYSSAESSARRRGRGRPPRAPCRRAAGWPRGCGAVSIIFPVAVHVPLSGSYSSPVPL